MAYLGQLNRFQVDEKDDNWIETIRYYPETPIAPRGAFNPWELERTRELFTAENNAWKEIQPLMKQYKALRVEAEALIVQFNQKVTELERMTGKKSGMFSATNIATFVASSSGNPYIMAALAIKMVVDIILGSQKKKKIEKKVKEIQALQSRILANYNAMKPLMQKAADYMRVGEAVRSAQSVKITADTQQAEGLYRLKQAKEKARGDAYRVMAEEHARTMPSRQGGDYAL